MAVYGFAWLVDDTGDEDGEDGEAGTGDRLALLDELETQLDLAIRLRATHPVFVRLQPVIAEVDVDVADFRRLIEASRIDQKVRRYATFDDLLAYCSFSAMPVGRLVLAVFGHTSPERVAWSDDVCAGLQIAEHVQDVKEDALRGRIYLPAEDLERYGCEESDLVAASANGRVRSLVLFECGRTRALLRSGVPLARSLPGRERFAVAGFTAGGVAALDAVEGKGGDVLLHVCRPGRTAFARRLLGILAGRYGEQT